MCDICVCTLHQGCSTLLSRLHWTIFVSDMSLGNYELMIP